MSNILINMKRFLITLVTSVALLSPVVVSAQVFNLNQIASSTQPAPYWGVLIGDSFGTHKAVASSSPTVASLFATSSIFDFGLTSGDCVQAGTGGMLTSASGACGSGSGSSFAYPFPSNATTTLLNFNGGLTSYASSTIGNGTQTGGLTISGGATTTGISTFLNNLNVRNSLNTANVLTVTTGVSSANISLLASGVTGAFISPNTTSFFNSGLTSYASSTIGNGTQTGGLTINGGATTTGNAYFAGNVGIGTTSPWGTLAVTANINTLGAPLLNLISTNGSAPSVPVLEVKTIATNSTGSVLSVDNGSGNLFTIVNNGNVGIGTTTPGTLLSLAGTTGIFASTTATSTFFGGGINLVTASGNTGCFAVNGTCIGGSGGGSSASSTLLSDNNTFSGTDNFTGTLQIGGTSLSLPVSIANGGTGVTSSTGTGSVVLSTSPTLVTPALGTPSALVGTNITGTGASFTAGHVTTDANLTGMITSVGNAAVLGSFTSANLSTALTDESGSGKALFGTFTSQANGDVLKWNGTNWVNAATSTLGLGNDTFLGLSDTVGSYNANRVLFESSSGVTDNGGFTYNGTTLTAPLLTVAGSGSSNSVSITGNNSNTSGTYTNTNISGNQTVADTGGYYGLNVAPNFNDATPGDTLTTFEGLQIDPVNSGAGIVSGMYGLNAIPQNTGIGTTTSMVGVFSTPRNTGAGTTTSMFGFYANEQAAAGSTGLVSNEYGLYTRGGNLSSAGATVSNYYSAFLATPFKTGAITNEYGLYQQDAAATNYFAGNVGVGTTTPGTLFSIGDTGSVNGINFALGTSTFSGSAHGINLTSGCFAINGNCVGGSGGGSGTVTSVATDSTLTGGPITTTGTLGLNLTNLNSWTGRQNFTNATSTLFTATTAWIGTLNLTNQLTVGNGGTGTNAFMTSNGIIASVGNSYLGQTAGYTLTTGLLTAPNASTTNISVNSTNVVGDGSASDFISPTTAFSVSYSTTTAWTGTTTIDVGPAPTGITFKTAYCHTNVGSLNVQLEYGTGPTLVLPMLTASSTIGTQGITSNNTASQGNDIQLLIGTPATAPTSVSCTFRGPRTSS